MLAKRIVASRSLGRSRLLSEFLLYVVERHIEGRADDINEQQIGILVFGRAEGYDSNEDNIVRSYARSLRKRMQEYFATEGRDESLLLEIPRGGYVPVFTPRVPANALEEEKPVKTAPPPSDDDAPESNTDQLQPLDDARRMPRWVAFSGLLCAGILLGILMARMHFPSRTFAEATTEDGSPLWSQIFSADQETYIVPSDDGLVIMQRLTERPVPLASYLTGEYRTRAKRDDSARTAELLKLGARRYTSVVDLDFIAHLAQLKQVVPGRMVVRYARDLRMDDLRSGNAVLVGSVEANPWIELFEPQMNFRFHITANTDELSGIANMKPRGNERPIYGNPTNDHTYGLIAYMPNLTGSGHVLIVGGLNTAGTQAATTFLMTPSLMSPILAGARDSRGELQPFELLIGADNVAAHASRPQIVAERFQEGLAH
jgi:hypothetical protein